MKSKIIFDHAEHTDLQSTAQWSGESLKEYQKLIRYSTTSNVNHTKSIQTYQSEM